MPFAAHIQQYRENRVNRGFDDDFWDVLRELAEAAQVTGLKETPLPKRILSVPPCPGLWRVYYVMTVEEQEEKPVSSTIYLGRAHEAKTTRQLGKLVEKWVNQANLVFNDFLRSEPPDPSILERIETPALREFYRAHAESLARDFDSAFLRKCVMEVEPQFAVFPELPLRESTPDGAFLQSYPHAVFESKLSVTSGIGLRELMAAYALVMERLLKRPVDNAIVLHFAYPAEEPTTVMEKIGDAACQSVQENLDKFFRLVLHGVARHQPETEGEPFPRFKSWKALMVRPPGGPEPPERAVCMGCRFRPTCWTEGGIA